MIRGIDLLLIEAGREVAFVTGPGHFPTRLGCSDLGVVQEAVTNRWGTHLVVKLADGSTDTVHVLKDPVSDLGIGAYLLPMTGGQ